MSSPGRRGGGRERGGGPDGQPGRGAVGQREGRPAVGRGVPLEHAVVDDRDDRNPAGQDGSAEVIGDENHVRPGTQHGPGQHPLGAQGRHRHAGRHRADVPAGHQLTYAEPAALRVIQDDEIHRPPAQLAQQLVGVPADAVVAVLHDPAVDQDAQRAGHHGPRASAGRASTSHGPLRTRTGPRRGSARTVPPTSVPAARAYPGREGAAAAARPGPGPGMVSTPAARATGVTATVRTLPPRRGTSSTAPAKAWPTQAPDTAAGGPSGAPYRRTAAA